MCTEETSEGNWVYVKVSIVAVFGEKKRSGCIGIEKASTCYDGHV